MLEVNSVDKEVEEKEIGNDDKDMKKEESQKILIRKCYKHNDDVDISFFTLKAKALLKLFL